MTDRRRRQKEQRAAKLEAEKKQSARRELGRRLGIALIFGVAVVAVLAATSLFGDDEGTLPGTYQGFREQPTACDADPPPAEVVQTFAEPEEQSDIDAETEVVAHIETSCGAIDIRLDPAGAPETVNSFVFLAREGFYDGQVFHRIVEDFLVQTGDPTAEGGGGPGYRVPDEFPPDDFVYVPGVVAMDNVGKGTTGSQLFIVTGESASALNPQFNVLGEVIAGDDTLERIQQVETATRPGTREQSLPLETVYVETITIEVTGS